MERKRSKRWLWIGLGVILVVVVVIMVMMNQGKGQEEINPSETVVAQGGVQTKESQKTETVKKDEPTEQPIEKEEVKQYEGNDPNESESITGAITYLSATDNALMVRVNIDQFLTGGQCEMVLINGGEEVYREVVGMVDAASTSTCEGFNVSRSELPSGETKITINMTAGEKTGVLEGEIEL